MHFDPTRREFLESFAAAMLGVAVSPAARMWANLATSSIRYVDITKTAGIDFIHYTGAFGKKLLPETMGSGCAFIDFDNDGNPDILLINGMDLAGHKQRRATMKLYRNDGKGSFTDVTVEAGLDIEMFGMGVAVGDYNNDGWDDIYITGVGDSRLLRNDHGKFRDVTDEAGVRNTGFGTSTAWVDYDRNGKLDLLVANYVDWTEKGDLYCSLDGYTKSYCTPESYKGSSCRLFHNLGDGRFEDVTKRAGLYDVTSKSLGVAILDFDQDDWPDIAISNDTQPNKLYRNNHDGTFTEMGMQAGISLDERGIARGAMGIDSDDFDRSGYPSLAIGNFSNQMAALYHNVKNRLFIDVAPTVGIGRDTLLSLTFGLFFFDYDLDGFDDLFLANGHVETDIARVQPRVSYPQVPLLFHNDGRDSRGNARFTNVGSSVGFTRPYVARGAAYADINNDGALDILVSTNGGPAYLFQNVGVTNNGLRIKAVGRRSNRSGIGAVVRVQTPAGIMSKVVHSGSSYCSQSELTLTFGMGTQTVAEQVEIQWPSGEHDILKNLAMNSTYTVEEGGKILNARPFKKTA
ncbi:MAG TPA: CRTAC1 family protein [Candidatus Dormibacteraeota bacterium]|jgi:hypothetical protein|nr:CRTAC1 family protein [Candidatus Dormibacteraeota bacterium]